MGSSGEHLGLEFSDSESPDHIPSASRGTGSVRGKGGADNRVHPSGGERTHVLHSPTQPTHERGTTLSGTEIEQERGISKSPLIVHSSPEDEESTLRSAVNQVQRDFQDLVARLLPAHSHPETSGSSSSTSIPSRGHHNPPIRPTSRQDLGPWAELPALFSDSGSGPALSFLTKKPDLAEVVPGHVADPFILREFPDSFCRSSICSTLAGSPCTHASTWGLGFTY